MVQLSCCQTSPVAELPRGPGGRPTFVTFCAPAESTEKVHRESWTPSTAKKNGLDTSESSVRSQGQVRPPLEPGGEPGLPGLPLSLEGGTPGEAALLHHDIPPASTSLCLQIKKESSPKPPGPPRPEKKKPSEPPKAASSPQVNALVARLPLLLPRIPSGECLTAPGAAAVRSSPPVLAPKITAAPLGGTVKVALPLPVGTASPSVPLGLAPGANGPAGLLSQQAAVPVLNVLLPGVGVPAAETPTKPQSAGGSEGPGPQDSQRPKATKRPLELPGNAAPQKRRRGRPRKRPEEGSPGETAELGSGAAVGANGGGSPGGGSATGPLGDSPAGGSLPTQVSVIQDGRTSAKAVDSHELAPEEEEEAQRSLDEAGSPLRDTGTAWDPPVGDPPASHRDGRTQAGASSAADTSQGGSPGWAGLCAHPGT